MVEWLLCEFLGSFFERLSSSLSFVLIYIHPHWVVATKWVTSETHFHGNVNFLLWHLPGLWQPQYHNRECPWWCSITVRSSSNLVSRTMKTDNFSCLVDAYEKKRLYHYNSEHSLHNVQVGVVNVNPECYQDLKSKLFMYEINSKLSDEAFCAKSCLRKLQQWCKQLFGFHLAHRFHSFSI